MVYLFYIYKLEKKRTLEKKHSPEVNSNHNEEHITNPCGFVTHIYYILYMVFVIYRAWLSAKSLTEQERLRHGNIYIS